jgi:threonine/homoserine/homoserine lactone efflux protein
MGTRIASACALLVFALAILLGLSAENTFSTTVYRALIAMGGTFIIGLVIGAMADKMAAEAKMLKQGKKEKSIEEKASADR